MSGRGLSLPLSGVFGVGDFGRASSSGGVSILGIGVLDLLSLVGVAGREGILSRDCCGEGLVLTGFDLSDILADSEVLRLLFGLASSLGSSGMGEVVRN